MAVSPPQSAALGRITPDRITVEATVMRGAHGMTFDPEGRLLIADTYRYRDPAASAVYRIAEGQPLEPVFRGVEIAGISATGSGYLIADFGASRVYETGFDFSIRRQWAVERPWNARAAPDGSIYVITYENFGRLTDRGAYQILIDRLDFPFDFAFEEGGVWITEQGRDAGRVSLWQPMRSGRYERRFSSGFAWSNPEGIVRGPDALFVADTALGDIIRIDNDRHAERLATGLGLPILIQLDRNDGLLIFSNRTAVGPALIKIRLSETPPAPRSQR